MLRELINQQITGHHGYLALKVSNPEAAALDGLKKLHQLTIIEISRGKGHTVIAWSRTEEVFNPESFEKFIGLSNCSIIGGKAITLESLGL